MMSYELNEEMMSRIKDEFSPEKIVSNFSRAISDKSQDEIEKIGQEMFAQYGTDLGQRSCRLGDEYLDRTYEVLRQAAETDDTLAFPLIPQRFVEIAFLSTQHLSTLAVIENNRMRLAFQIKGCKIYNEIKNLSGENIAKLLTCKRGCLNTCETIFKNFSFEDITIKMNASTDSDGYCEFMVSR